MKPRIDPRHIINSLVIAITAMMAFSCSEERFSAPPDYTVSGEPVRLKVPVLIPEMNAETRGDLSENQLNRVESLWIRTYNAETLEATCEWKKLTPKTFDLHNMREVEIDTQSGYTYIVAVANVSNLGVTSDNINEPKPLNVLLEAANTWDKFLKIAVLSPSDLDNVNAPQEGEFAMAGCYSDAITEGEYTEHVSYNEWQNKNFQPYFIPASTDKIEFKGGIHLRRLVSHITFNFSAGDNIELEVNSYRVMNAPKFSWLYERSAEKTKLVNFGDYATSAEDALNYYVDVPQFSSQFIKDKTVNRKAVQSFDFWQAENKHTGTCTSYADRGKKTVEEGITLFTSLTGETWTPNNEASYVVVDCDVDYKKKITVDANGKEDANGTEVERSGHATYFIHLGYIMGASSEEKSKDFNCFRNVDYTYNVTVNGIDDIRVDAVAATETYHNEEGLVVDLDANPISIDAHYAVFNIYLSEKDLEENFGFIITTYDNGKQITLSEKNPRATVNGKTVIYTDNENTEPIDSKYYNWIELRPTVHKDSLALYKPRFGPEPYNDGKTFLLTDMYNIKDKNGDNILIMPEKGKSTSGWYTVFVNEYTYEPMYGEDGYGDESNTMLNGKPAWMSYVNQNPRRFYIKVSYRESPDGNSVYARSKYAVEQQSLMTYYSQINVDKDGTAIGVERENETLGLNLRHDNTSGGNSPTNGRWNAAQYLTTGADDHHDVTNISVNRPNVQGRSNWNFFLDMSDPLEVPGVTDPLRLQGGPEIKDRTIANGNPHKLRRIKTADNTSEPNFTDPQVDRKYNIKAMSALVIRNRDNNGNGKIDPQELRWYIPTLTRYVGMTLGENAMPQKLMMFDEIKQLPYVIDKKEFSFTSGNINNCFYSRYMYLGSNYAPIGSADNNVLWAMEGTSMSKYQHVTNWSTANNNMPLNPWQIRCVRNLGSNLQTATIGDKVTLPFTHNSSIKILSMDYFNLAAIRTYKLTGTGPDNPNYMPIHTINSSYNSVYAAFEYAENDIDYPRPENASENDFSSYIVDFLNNNPCKALDGGDWRVPNQIELTMLLQSGIFPKENIVWLSSTVEYFNKSNGEGNNDIDGKIFLATVPTQTMLLAWGNYQPKNNPPAIKVRCVRDVNP